jgi:hypothetical protein
VSDHYLGLSLADRACLALAQRLELPVVTTDRAWALGAEHPATLTARNNLALSYHSAGRTADAIALQEPVLADLERLLGPEHPDTLTARSNLASDHANLVQSTGLASFSSPPG